MIQKLKRKLALINFSVLALVLLAVSLSVFLLSRAGMRRTADDALHRILLQTDAPYFPGRSDEVQMPYFSLRIFPDGSAQLMDSDFTRISSIEEVQQILNAALAEGRERGYLPSYRLCYRRMDGPYYEKIAFVDTSVEEHALQRLMLSLIGIGLLALAALTLLSYRLAALAIRPVEESIERQRRFVSDASHELKTPLTVILSSAGLLAGELPPGSEGVRFADNISAEGKRMQALVEEMLTLERSEDPGRSLSMEALSLSELVTDETLRFEPLAYENGKPLRCDIAEDIRCRGNEEALRRILSILLENAMKYGEDSKEISVSLRKEGGRALLRVTNAAKPLSPEELHRLFDRFYRADPARTADGGFGLGLSIARALAQRLGSTLNAEQKDGALSFVLSLAAL